MVFIALSRIAASPRSTSNLFDSQLLIKSGSVDGSGDTCIGGDECQGQCNLDALYDTDICRDACKNQANARDCGCTTAADACWNRDCQARCSEDYLCESEDCQAACNGEDEEKVCGCRAPT
jgi:hypothetical protein